MSAKRRPTMADVAAHAGVSLSTVSLTFSGAGPISPEMKQRVEKAAADLGYAGPSPQGRALRSGRSHIVGIVINEQLSQSLRDPIALRVCDALIGDLSDVGLGALLLPSPYGDPDEHPLLETAAMDAAVVMRSRGEDEPALDILERRGIPFVVMEGWAPEGAGQVVLNDEAATEELLRHLVELGHERIATVTLPLGQRRETTVVENDDAVRNAWTPTHNRLRAFEKAGIEPAVVVEARGSLVAEGIAAGHLALTHESKPTAVVCQSDLIAGGVVIAARELGMRVPGDVSITGFDGVDLPWLAPLELTTQVQDPYAKGHSLASQVKALLAGEPAERAAFDLEFRRGNSTGRAPRK